MSAQRKRTPRDARRRTLGQNFLVDRNELAKLVKAAEPREDDLIVEIGAGVGALTVPLAESGARVLAVEPDPVWAARLRDTLGERGLLKRVKVVRADLRSMRLPTERYRVIANPPFGLTTALFARLFDDPARGPTRADLLVQLEVARKRVIEPPATLRSAAWAPWWTFEMGPVVPANAFRPRPKVDAALLTVRRRDPAILPNWMAPSLRELLRPGWQPPKGRE